MTSDDLQVIVDDPYLKPHKGSLEAWKTQFQKWVNAFKESEGSIENIAKSYKRYGVQPREGGGVELLEWAPMAKSMSLFGDFNGWNRDQFYAHKNEYGVFQLSLSPEQAKDLHNTRYKL